MCKTNRLDFMLDQELERELRKPPRATLEHARVFVHFACCCLRGTPAGSGKVVFDLLSDPRLHAALASAETWVRVGSCPRLAAVIDEALSAADEPLSAAERIAADAAATVVWAAGDAEHEPSLGINLAVAAAAKARRAGMAALRESVLFQWELSRLLWPSQIQDVPRAGSADNREWDPAHALGGVVVAR